MVSGMSKTLDLMPEPPQSEELFVTFANTLEFTKGIPLDHVEEPGTLLAWLKANGLLTERGRAAEAQRLLRDPAEAQRRLERFRYLRTLVHAIAERENDGRRPTREQIRDLNQVLRHGLHCHQLVPEAGGNPQSCAQGGGHL